MSRCIPGEIPLEFPVASISPSPAWLQLGSVSSSERSIIKMFHLGCYSGKKKINKNQIAGLLVKPRICSPALGAASVPDKLRVLLIKVKAWGHFWDCGGALEDSPPRKAVPLSWFCAQLHRIPLSTLIQDPSLLSFEAAFSIICCHEVFQSVYKNVWKPTENIWASPMSSEGRNIPK